MEYRPAKKITSIIFVTLFFLINGCGFFEDDGIEYQKSVIGNIKIQKQKNDNDFSLVFAESDQDFAGIVQNCKIILYDTINNKIFVEEFINETSNTYYQITILDALNHNVLNAINKVRIYKKDFDKIRKENLVKWEFHKP